MSCLARERRSLVRVGTLGKHFKAAEKDLKGEGNIQKDEAGYHLGMLLIGGLSVEDSYRLDGRILTIT